VVARASTADVRFSGGGSGPLVTLTMGGRRLSLSWPAPLPEPSLAGDTATYADVVPGADLLVRATAIGFSEVLAVRTRQAASNPVLRELTFAVGGSGTRIGVTPEGGLAVLAHDGSTLATAGAAAMWDSSSGTAGDVSTPVAPADGARTAPVAMRVSDGQLVLTPDQALLSDPAATLPIFVDPSFQTFSPGRSRWAYADSTDENNNDGLARVGRNPLSGALYRSFYEFPLGAGGVSLAGTRVNSVTLNLVLFHSYSCDSTLVTLWGASGITATPRSSWNSMSLGGYLDTQWGHAHKDTGACGWQPDMPMAFGGNLTSVIQTAANQSWTGITFGLSARDANGAGEYTQDRWKKFYTDASAVLTVVYNSYPTLSQASTAGLGCAQGAGRPVVNTTTVPVSAVISDVDAGATVSGRFRYSTDAGTTWSAIQQTAPTASGLIHTTTFSLTPTQASAPYIMWEVVANDGIDDSRSAARCEFSVDTAAPGAPLAASSQLDLTGVNAPPSVVAGRPAAVTLSPATGDTDVAGYRFAVADQARTPTSWVPANRDGSASVAITPISDDPFVGNTLTMVAVDRAGNASTQVSHRFLANPAASTPHVRGDVTGDGKAELISAGDAGNGQMQAWALAADPAGGGGFVGSPVAGWDAGAASGFTAARSTVVSGDFDGDGRTDVGVLHDETGGRTTFAVLRSVGNGFAAPAAPQWDSQVVGGAWAYSALKVGVGDVDGNGRDDLVVLANLGSSWRMSVLRSTGSSGSIGFATEQWATGTSPWTSMKIVVGDFTGDGRADVGELFAVAPTTTRLYVHASRAPTALAFADGVLWWESCAGCWDWGRSTPVAADFTGDGRTDLAVFATYDVYQTKLWLFTTNATGTGVSAPTLGFDSGINAWWGGAVEPMAGDFNGDGRTDLGVTYRRPGPGQVRLVTFTSTGTGYATPVSRWAGAMGTPGTGAAAPDAATRYRLIANHSDKCVDVDANGGSTPGTKVQQWQCIGGQANQLFFATPVGVGFYQLRPSHVTGMCLEVSGFSTADTATFVLATCSGSVPGNQVFSLEYLFGWGDNTEVRVRPNHTGKCMDVSGISTADGVPIQQYGCWGGANQAYYLRPGA